MSKLWRKIAQLLNHLGVLEIRVPFLNIKRVKLWRKTGEGAVESKFAEAGAPSQPQSIIKVGIVH